MQFFPPEPRAMRVKRVLANLPVIGWLFRLIFRIFCVRYFYRVPPFDKFVIPKIAAPWPSIDGIRTASIFPPLKERE